MGCLHARITLCRLGEPGWKQSCVDDSAAVVPNLAFTVLGAQGVGRNHSCTLCIMTGLCRTLLLPQCSVGQFLVPLYLTAGAAHIPHTAPRQIASQNQAYASSGLGETTCPVCRAWWGPFCPQCTAHASQRRFNFKADKAWSVELQKFRFCFRICSLIGGFSVSSKSRMYFSLPAQNEEGQSVVGRLEAFVWEWQQHFPGSVTDKEGQVLEIGGFGFPLHSSEMYLLILQVQCCYWGLGWRWSPYQDGFSSKISLSFIFTNSKFVISFLFLNSGSKMFSL